MLEYLRYILQIRIAALNDSGSDIDEVHEDKNVEVKVTKEAQENAAYSLYHKGLSYERAGATAKAIYTFEELLKDDFITKAVSDGKQTHQSDILKYSALKNLSKLYSSEGRNEEAIEVLLEAFAIDSTDVSVCYRLGVLAIKLYRYVLACRAFEKGIELSPDHWPCLDNLITLFYVLDNYEACLYCIGKSLARDCGYVKGLVIRKAIYKEQPCLEEDYASAFGQCDAEELRECTACLQDKDESEVLEEAMLMRRKLKEQCKPKPRRSINLDLAELSWASLGKRLVEIFYYIEDNAPELMHFSSDNNSTEKAASDVDGYHGSDPLSNHDSIAVTMVMEDILSEIELVDDDLSNDRSVVTFEESGCDADIIEQVLSNIVQRVAKEGSNSNVVKHKSVSAVNEDGQSCNGSSLLANGSTDAENPAELSGFGIDAVECVLSGMMEKVEEAECDSDVTKEVLYDIVQRVASDVDRAVTNEQNTAVAELLEELVSNIEKDERLVSPVVEDHVYTRNSPSLREQEKTKKGRYVSVAECKRRSMRVKPPTTKPGTTEKAVRFDKSNHVAEIKELFTNLLSKQVNGEQTNQKDEFLNSVTHSVPAAASSEPDSFSDEQGDIREFLTYIDSSRGVINVMRDWLLALSKKRQFVWSSSLASVYVDVYEKHRPCYQIPNIFSDEAVEADVLLALLWMELKIDRVISAKAFESQLESVFVNEFTYWEMVIGNEEKLPAHCQELSTRYYYMGARYYNGLGQPLTAINVYKNLLTYLESLNDKDFSVRLSNNSSKVLLNRKMIETELAVLERTEALNELASVYSDCDYAKVLSLLEPTFDTELTNRYTDSRLSQLNLLINTLDKLTDFNLNIKWLMCSLQELVYHVESSHKGNWGKIITRNLRSLDTKLDNDESFPSKYVKPLGMSCLKVIKANVSALESGKRMLVDSVLPWIITSKLCDILQVSTIGSPPLETPPSLEILKAGHKFLAKHGLCTSSDGLLLQYFLEKLFQRLSIAGTYNRQQMEQQVSQCIFCLYGHPHKKIKAKNLSDHGASTVSLTWAAAQQLFDYYKPKSVPDFDSYKSSTIPAELEGLFRKLVSEVPPEHAPDPKIVKVVDAFLNDLATLDDLDSLSPPSCSTLCSEAYYLLADYYFKNKEPLKAIKHYIQDLYYKPDRFDSWAGMALAKSSKLESRLRLMERQSYDGAFQKLAVSTVQSFTRALALKQDNVKLWIEYACSAYQLHSFASRVIKTKKSELSSSELATFTALKKDTLVKSRHCYEQASLCKADEMEEAWIHHYMLGKISEKSNEDPSIYLSHYQKAGKCLHDEGAQYPVKISYMYNLPHLAVEALEMYYRVHASILKSAQRSQSTQHFQLYSEVIQEMKKCPFTVAQISSPQTPLTRKRKLGSEAIEKPSGTKVRKSESELLISSCAPKVSTRRQEKLRLDAEIVYEVMEEIIGRIEAVDCKGEFRHSSCVVTHQDTEKQRPHIDTTSAPIKRLLPHTASASTSTDSTRSHIETLPSYSVQMPSHMEIIPPRTESIPSHKDNTPFCEKRMISQTESVPSQSEGDWSSTMSIPANSKRKHECCISFLAGDRVNHTEEEPTDTEDSVLRDIKALLRDVVTEVDRKLDTVPSYSEKSMCGRLSTVTGLSLSCLNTSPPSSNTLNNEVILAKGQENFSVNERRQDFRIFPESSVGTSENRKVKTDGLQDHLTVQSECKDILEFTETIALQSSHHETVSQSCARNITSQLYSEESPPRRVANTESEGKRDADPSMSQVVSSSFAQPTTPTAPDSTCEDGSFSSVRSIQVKAESLLEDFQDACLLEKEVQSSLRFPITIDVTRATSSITSAELLTAVVSKKVAEHFASTNGNDSSNNIGMADGANIASTNDSAADVSIIIPADSSDSGDVTSITITAASNVHTKASTTTVTSPYLLASTVYESPAITSIACAVSSPASTVLDELPKIPLESPTISSIKPFSSGIASMVSSDGAHMFSIESTSFIATSTSSMTSTTSSVTLSPSSMASTISSILSTSSPVTFTVSSVASTSSLTSSSTTFPIASTAFSKASPSLTTSTTSSMPSTTSSIPSTTSSTASKISSSSLHVAAASTLTSLPPSTSLHPPLASSPTSATTAPSKETSASTSPEILSRDELIQSCIAGLKLCVQRYPLHYKSYYRLAKTFLHDNQRKDLDKVQDLLLGNTSKKREDRFVPQGLFQDRKHNNFFNGVWSNPVQEIERAGSFGAHLYKSIYLLLQFLHEKRDYHLLYQLHTQLQRTPDQERKFLKDADRLLLSSKAIEFAIHSLYKTIGSDTDSKAEYNYAASLHQAHKWFIYCNKHTICVPNAQVLLMKAYKSYKLSVDKDFDATNKVPVAFVKDFCQQMFSSRSKDKCKSSSTEIKQAEGAKPASTSSPSSTKPLRDTGTTTLPSVRGSFQSFDKAKKLKHTVQNTDAMDTSVQKVSAPSDIPSTSWLNKAKDGTKALASMFTKPK
ncbi:calcineurin-binding protein cabin-1-like [Watersipora subatra]|uniref:calcineurin-binding protein cabin-1-like n=1 Tax=Watersipora subatra TaxID=2589382 RepID=UPI00355ACEC1